MTFQYCYIMLITESLSITLDLKYSLCDYFLNLKHLSICLIPPRFPPYSLKIPTSMMLWCHQKKQSIGLTAFSIPCPTQVLFSFSLSLLSRLIITITPLHICSIHFPSLLFYLVDSTTILFKSSLLYLLQLKETGQKNKILCWLFLHEILDHEP